MDYQEYIRGELLVLIPVLYFVGNGLKKSRLADTAIPFVLGVIAVALSSLWVLGTSSLEGLQDLAAALFTAITQGVLVAGASVYIHQLHLQAHKK